MLLSNFNFSQTHQLYGSIGNNFPTTTALVGQSSNFESTKINTSSFSKGLVFQAGYTFGFHQNIMIDLNIGYLIGVSNETYYSYVFENPMQPGYYFTKSSEYSNKNISISPSIKLKTDIGNFSPYVKFGASINFITIEDNWKNHSNKDFGFVSVYRNLPYNTKYTYSSDYTVGWLSGIGFSYLVASNISVFTEFQVNGITFYADEVKINGQTSELKDEMPFGFVDTLGWAIKDYPFSSMGVLLGFSISI